MYSFVRYTKTDRHSQDIGSLYVEVNIDSNGVKSEKWTLKFADEEVILQGLIKKDHVNKDFKKVHDCGADWNFFIHTSASNVVFIENDFRGLSFRFTRKKIREAWNKASKDANQTL